VLRFLERVAEVIELLLHQQPGDRRLEIVRDAFGRRMRPVRRAERVVHIQVAELREAA